MTTPPKRIRFRPLESRAGAIPLIAARCRRSDGRRRPGPWGAHSR